MDMFFYELCFVPLAPFGSLWGVAQALPSTRAGGQDDVSFTNSLK